MIRKHMGILCKMWISMIYIASMLILQLYIDKHKEKKGEGWKNSTLLSSTIFSFFLFMQKDDKEEFISAKHIRDICKLIRCSKTQENELWTQSHYCTYSKKKVGERVTTFTLLFFEEKMHFPKGNILYMVKGFKETLSFWKLIFESILFLVYCFRIIAIFYLYIHTLVKINIKVLQIIST